MTELILRFAGPAQSWAGYRVKPGKVPSHPVPTVSGVAGFLGACLGERDYLSIADRFDLRVRLDRHNAVQDDRQVAAGPLLGTVEHARWERANDVAHAGQKVKAPNKSAGRVVLTGGELHGMSIRGVVPHAEFICALRGSDSDTRSWLDGVSDPVWMPYLGRRGYAPTWPVLLGIWDGSGDIFAELPRVSDEGDDGDVLVHDVSGDYDGHTSKIGHVAPPTCNREEQLAWIASNLTR